MPVWPTRPTNSVCIQRKDKNGYWPKHSAVSFLSTIKCWQRKKTYEKFRGDKEALKKQKFPTPAKYKQERRASTSPSFLWKSPGPFNSSPHLPHGQTEWRASPRPRPGRGA